MLNDGAVSDNKSVSSIAGGAILVEAGTIIGALIETTGDVSSSAFQVRS